MAVNCLYRKPARVEARLALVEEREAKDRHRLRYSALTVPGNTTRSGHKITVVPRKSVGKVDRNPTRLVASVMASLPLVSPTKIKELSEILLAFYRSGRDEKVLDGKLKALVDRYQAAGKRLMRPRGITRLREIAICAQ